MKLYNTLTQTKEDFRPITDNHVSMYHCGPTVYDYVHIGNLRSFLLADFIRRSFEYLGYDVTQVMNITDIGHLVSDADAGEDKMSKGLRREGKEITVPNMLALANQYAEAFTQDLEALHIQTPHHMPKASDHIDEDIALITILEEKGFTYSTSDGLYFDTSKMEDYGKLGGLDLEGEHQSRIGENEDKRNPADFALWKKDPSLGWESPWGLGFPGWHIECSGMSKKYLGEHFDIHTGGIDNRDVHHNNEIAQSESAHGHSFVNYWMHGEMLNFNGEKLSKSTGGNITLAQLHDKGFSPMDYRYLALQSHYRSKMNFSWDILTSAQKGLAKVQKQVQSMKSDAGKVHETYTAQFKEKIEDDINLPQALAVMHEVLKSDLPKEDIYATIIDFDKVLGLGLADYRETPMSIPEDIQVLLEKRKEARNQKDWESSDRLRDEIQEQGYIISDLDGEQYIEKK